MFQVRCPILGLIMRTIFFFLLVFSLGARAAEPPCKPVNLRCEYLSAPLGIDAAHPRLSWRLEDKRAGAVQTAYAVSVGTDPNEMKVWMTGRRNSPDQMTTYEGPALQPFTRYYWRVDVWDKDGQMASSPVSSF